MSERGHTYWLAPIDWWYGWMTPGGLVDHAWFVNGLLTIEDCERLEAEIGSIVDHALAEMRRAGWEGDVQEGPFVAALPVDLDNCGPMDFLVAVKQENNGSVFIWSPVALPWLSEEKVA